MNNNHKKVKSSQEVRTEEGMRGISGEKFDIG